MKFMVIDGNSILNRAFYGVRLLTNHDGLPTNAIYGFLSTLFRLQDEYTPDRTIVCFDVKEKTFRHQKFDSYKATRKGMPDELAAQLPVMKEVLDALGIIRCEKGGYEADDLIGTISRKAEEQGDDCLIVTGDRDSLQLVSAHTTVHLVSSKGGQDTSRDITPEAFREKYGFDPIRLIDLKALMGDSSDNISGVPGVGEKTAMNLLHTFGSLDEVYRHLDAPEIKKGLRDKLTNGEQAARDSYWLATIERDAPLPIDMQALPDAQMDRDALYDLLTRLEFKSFLTRLGLSKTEAPAPTAAERKRVELTDLESAQKQLDALTELSAVPLFAAPGLRAFALLAQDTVYLLSSDSFSVADWDAVTARLFAGDIKLVMHDAKPTYVELLEAGLAAQGVLFDTSIAAYLLDPTASAYDLERVALSYLNRELPKVDLTAEDAFSPLGGRDSALAAMTANVEAIADIYAEASARLEEQGMHKLFFEMEMPLMTVLAEMQQAGCKADADQLCAFGEQLDTRIAALTEQIYEAAGHEFNIQSSKQLGVVLFEELGLPYKKKTKTGYSTSAEVLESLAGYHPMIADVLEYRQLTKLKSTYVDGLLKVIAPDGRIHSHFQQTVTATGRLSSVDPNLQNIPVRTELGRELRRMFVAEQGRVLVDADYSQIELRVLAHVADDDAMIEAFRGGQDIHATTASKVYGVPVEEVTPQMRSSCKAVNFGIVYGISDFSLAQDIGVTRKEAAAFIQSYLDTYPGVHHYMESIKQSARETGYVETLFGRRRALPELNSKNFNLRSFGERAAMNTPIQGTAADIIKIAMLRVRDRLKAEGFEARLILQVHDELILEAPEHEAERAAALLREEMEHAAELRVPLVAEAKIGHSWYETK
ncbi:DNA polymerase I [Butyricicoccus pullicaecorum]|uniref:DNA polymerase I n=1 Tax=Butyricicoccus pullicaecorum TaxID=501571 RepID=A0A1Y4L9Q8_9FIRM|nr:DNA polymerase I [Butyricicoccus pullicaecorum]OUP52209.1 DNA polymerase I [Butyricicoccus pullicaecorum]